MTTTYLRGPDAQRLLSSLAVNSFATFDVGRSRHFVCCSLKGYLVGDGILYSLTPEEMVLVGRAAGHNWVRFCAETGGWDVSIEADEIFPTTPPAGAPCTGIKSKELTRWSSPYRLTGAPLPEAPWSHIFPVSIAGHQVWAQRHTMAGNPGCEFFGPWDEGPAVKGGDPRGRIRVRSAPGRVARLFHERSGAGLDPTTDAGHLHRRRAPPVP